MATQPVTPQRLTLQVEQNSNETIVHCAGRINAENSEMLQKQISSLIPESRTQNAATSARIVLDLSNVTHVDSSGLGALLGVWTAAKNKGCDLEMANLNPRVEKLVEITKLDTVFKRGKVAASTSTGSTPDVAPTLGPEEAWQEAINAAMVPYERRQRFVITFHRASITRRSTRSCRF